ncbi:MAG TPA: NfeD family protein [Pyrinomonadaceae bacterium]|nr:NfeD family protein [Pyrinomonadaceae bacterium]
MSDNLAWVLWTVLGVILVIAEVFTPGFVLLWFGVGAIAAALASVAGAGYPLQFLVFFAVSIALTAASRTIFSRYFVHPDNPEGLKSGAASLPGKVGTVVTSSRGALNEGAVKVFGSTWTAYPAEGEPPLEAGDRVVVESLRGASIYVRRLDDRPHWRAQELVEGSKDE